MKAWALLITGAVSPYLFDATLPSLLTVLLLCSFFTSILVKRARITVQLLPVFFLLTTLAINYRLSGRLPDIDNKSLHLITGVVSSLPQKGMDSIRFDFNVDNAGDSIPDKLRVQWYTRPHRKPESSIPEVHAGERWRLQLELRTTRRRVNFSGVGQER